MDSGDSSPDLERTAAQLIPENQQDLTLDEITATDYGVAPTSAIEADDDDSQRHSPPMGRMTDP